MVDEFLGIKYKLEKSEKFDEYMKALGVGMVVRKLGAAASPVVDLTKADDGTYTLKSSSTFKNIVLTFKLGEEFEQETPDGRKVKTIITLDGNKLIEEQKGDKATKIIREFSKDQIVMTLSVDDVVCTRTYKVASD